MSSSLLHIFSVFLLGEFNKSKAFVSASSHQVALPSFRTTESSTQKEKEGWGPDIGFLSAAAVAGLRRRRNHRLSLPPIQNILISSAATSFIIF
jgi:hypothetical protein